MAASEEAAERAWAAARSASTALEEAETRHAAQVGALRTGCGQIAEVIGQELRGALHRMG